MRVSYLIRWSSMRMRSMSWTRRVLNFRAIKTSRFWLKRSTMNLQSLCLTVSILSKLLKSLTDWLTKEKNLKLLKFKELESNRFIKRWRGISWVQNLSFVEIFWQMRWNEIKSCILMENIMMLQDVIKWLVLCMRSLILKTKLKMH